MSEDGNIGENDARATEAAEYVLGLLTAAERRAFDTRLDTDAALRAELAFWQQRFAGLDAGFAEVPAPRDTWRRIEKRLFAEAQHRRTLWDSVGFWRSFAAVTTALAIMAVAINLATPPPADPNLFAAQLVAALHAEGSTVSFVALYNPQTKQVRLTALSGDAVPDKDFELWAIEGDQKPKSMGIVPVTSRTEMQLSPDVLAGFGAGTILAITLEQKGGSPTGAPQGPIVAKGAATPI